MPELSKLNYINVNSDGTYKQSGQYETTPADVEAIFAHLRTLGAPKKVVMHFHGGLVDEGAGMETARSLAPVYLAAGAHPLMIVWETGFFDTLRTSLTNIRDSPLFEKLLKIVIRNVAKRLGVDIGGRGPNTPPTDEEIEAALRDRSEFEKFDKAARGGARVISEEQLDHRRDDITNDVEDDLTEVTGADLTMPDPAKLLLRNEIRQAAEEQARGVISTALLVAVVNVVFHVIRRYLRGREHGFYNTIFEELLREIYVADFGVVIWSAMKLAAEKMWRPNDGLTGIDRHPGHDLLEGLAALQAERGLTIDLVGHSAGSIAIIRMLDAIEKAFPALRIRNVIFLAPACRSDLFVRGIIDRPDRYDRFRMYTMHDELEMLDPLLQKAPLVYASSLLYFISGVLEGESDTPLAGMQRYVSQTSVYGGDPHERVRRFLQAKGNARLILSTTADDAADGLRCLARHHGGFADDERLRDSLRYLIGQ